MKYISVAQHTVGGCVSTRFDNQSPTAFLVLKLQAAQHKPLHGKITYEDHAYFLTICDGPNQILKMWIADKNIGLLTTEGDWFVTLPRSQSQDSLSVEMWAKKSNALPVKPGTIIKIPGYRYI